MSWIMGSDSSVGIATAYGMDCPGIESRWVWDFPHHSQTGPKAHPDSCSMSTESFRGVKQPGRGFDHTPPSSTEFK